MTTLVAVPVIAPTDETAAAFDRYDRPVFIIDNTPDNAYLARYGTDPRFTFISSPSNYGVARSWNFALARGADLTVILSQSVVFGAGLADAVARLEAAADEYGALTTLGLHVHAWTPHAVETIGRWDENFWPGWFEDNDYLRRAALLDVHNAARPLPKVEIAGATTTYARTKMQFDDEGGYDHAIQYKYYVAKHGGGPGEEGYDSPFNTGRPWTWWPTAPPPEAQRRQHARHSEAYEPPPLDA